MSSMLRAFLFTVLCGLCAAVMPLGLLAQESTTTPEFVPKLPELTLNVTPPHPRALTGVTIEAENYIMDVNSADFVWKVNGRVRQRGKGVKTFSLVLGPLGNTTTIVATAVTPDGRTFEKELSLTPADVYLLWQSNGYTPPFYRGKALFPYQGTILVAAIPEFTSENGKKIPERDLVYTWKENDTTLGDASGYGKNLFLVRGDIPIRAKTVSVEVATPDGALVADTSILLEPVSPRLVFYENHPLYGLLFNQALTSGTSVQGEDFRLEAVPYYFEVPTRKHTDLSYTWHMNGSGNTQQESSLTFRRVAPQSGTSRIAVEAQSASRPFQAARSTLELFLPELFNDFLSGANQNEP